MTAPERPAGPFDDFDRAVDDLLWYFGEAAEQLGVHGQSVDGGGGNRVFDDEASWRKMASMCDASRIRAVTRLRLVEAALRGCAEHLATFRLAFTAYGRVSSPVVRAFTSGRVVLIGLAADSAIAREAAGEKGESVDEWLECQARNTGSWAVFDRMRVAAKGRLIVALRAYAAERDRLAEAVRQAADAEVSKIRGRARRSRPNGESWERRRDRLLADRLRLLREAGID